jgi:predicted nucleic acid-binding protein
VIVVDTNLLLDYHLTRPRTLLAEAVLARDPAWAAPVLWRSEFRNALVRLVFDGMLEAEAALRLAASAERRMAGGEHQVTSELVLRLAMFSGCSAYDCEFVALAQDLGARLVTSDVEILEAFPGVATTPERFARR